jgi:hypothetical protein
VVLSTVVSSGNDVTGDSSVSTVETSTTSQTQLETNQTQTVSFTETGAGSSTSTNIGNDLTGSFSLVETSSSTLTTVQTDTNTAGGGTGSGQAVSTTLVTTASSSLNRSGNSVTGAYTLTEIDGDATVQDQTTTVGQAPPAGGTADSRSESLHETSSSSNTRNESGNNLSGSSTFTETATSSDTLTKTDTYSVIKNGQTTSDGSDHQTVTTTGSSNSSGTANSITGSFSESGGGTTTVVTVETGSRSGQTYSLSDTDTTTVSGQSTTGNKITGSETTAETTTESSTLTNVGQAVPAGGPSFTLTETEAVTTTLTATSNLVTGSYSQSAAESSSTSIHQQSTAGTYSLIANNNETLSLTRTETGNSIAGTFSRTTTESDSTTLTETGNNASGSFSLTETTSQSPTIHESGNSVTGSYSLSESPTETYALTQTFVAPGGASANSYSLHETGSNAQILTQTGNTITGDYSQTLTQTDNYTLSETGQLMQSLGERVYTETLTATDTSTQIEAGNSLTGAFNRTVTGNLTNGTLVENGTIGGTPFSLPGFVSASYAVNESGNPVDGALALSESGNDRYSLLNQFANPTNASGAPSWSGGTSSPTSNGPGNLDYSPTGAPFSIAAAPESPTSGTSSPGRESPQAAEQDQFAQAGLDLLHEYCFRAGTRVLTAAGAKPIEEIQPGELVASVNDQNPDGPIEWKPVEQVYRNAPAEILNVHVALVVPLSGGSLAVPRSGGQSGNTGTSAIPEPPEAGSMSVLGTTFNHPFQVLGKGWLPAARLQIGDRLRSDDSSTVTVTDLFHNREVVPVFNLRVVDNHTYFVGGHGGPFVLVHNQSASTKDELPTDIDIAFNALYGEEGRVLLDAFHKAGGKVVQESWLWWGAKSDFEYFTRGDMKIQLNQKLDAIGAAGELFGRLKEAAGTLTVRNMLPLSDDVSEADVARLQEAAETGFRKGNAMAATLGEMYYKGVAGAGVGGTIAVTVSDTFEGDYMSAAMGIAALGALKVGKGAGKAVQFELKFGSKSVTISAEAANLFRLMPAGERKALLGELKAAKTIGEAQQVVAGLETLAKDLVTLGFDPAKGYASFKQFKNVFGKAGSKKAWHHIVEQTINSGKFAQEILQNPANLLPLPHGAGSIHAEVSAYYSSIQEFTGGLTVREWLSKKSFKEQFDFGVKTIKEFGGTRYLPDELR